MRRFLPLLALLAVLLPQRSFGARMFVIDTISSDSDPSLPWPTGPAGLTSRFDAAVLVATVPGQGATPTLFVFDVLCSPAVVAFTQAHIPAARFLGTHFSDLRALVPTRPALIGAILKKLVSRVVVINGQSVTVQLIVPQADATAGDVTVADVPFNRWFGVNDGSED